MFLVWGLRRVLAGRSAVCTFSCGSYRTGSVYIGRTAGDLRTIGCGCVGSVCTRRGGRWAEEIDTCDSVVISPSYDNNFIIHTIHKGVLQRTQGINIKQNGIH